MSSIPLYELQLHATLDKLSNGEPVAFDEAWIEHAGESFKAALRKQLTVEARPFVLRMSNIGRPACQLQMDKAGAPKGRMSYNHIVRMMLGDATECIVELLMKVASLPITGGKNKVTLNIGGVDINGEDDIDLDNKTFDVKSCSPWAYENKWRSYPDMKSGDDFGYVAQLAGYATAQGKQTGGWIVMNKSTGEIKILEHHMREEELSEVLGKAAETVKKVSQDAPFERCFEPEDETFYSRKTGNKRLAQTCHFCDFRKTCWPDAVYRPQGGSKAQSPKLYWYSDYIEPLDPQTD